MKKLFIFATAAIAFASCSENDLGNIAQENTLEQATAVSFGTYMGESATRAGTTGSITTASLQTGGTHAIDGFAVYGYLTSDALTDNAAVAISPNFMWNQQVTYSSGNWTYSPVKYWPNGTDANNNHEGTGQSTEVSTQYLSFYAYAPYVPAGDATAGITALPANNATDLKISYKMPDEAAAANVVDLLWGMRGNTSGYGLASGSESAEQKENKYNVNLTKQNTTEKVSFNFKHALAKIGGYDNTANRSGLKVIYDIDGNSTGSTGFGTTDANTLVTINSITISNGVDASNNSLLAATGKFDISTGTWSEQALSGTANPAISATISGTQLNTVIAEPAEAPTHPSEWSLEGVTTSAKDVYASGADVAPFLFIPGFEQTIKVSVTYTVRTFDEGLAVPTGETVKCTKVTQTITNNVTLPATTEPNKYYTLVMHLGLTSVKFTAEVVDWETTTSGSGVAPIEEQMYLPSNVVVPAP
mgnify:CR=1 FL=1